MGFCEFQNDPMGKVLCGVKQSYMFDLLLETRMPHERFLPYKPGGELSWTGILQRS